MAKITREPQTVFGGGLTPSNNIAVFGSLKAGAPTYSGDPSTIQSAAYANGWSAAVVANQAPALQDMNALFYVDTYQLAYLLQTGVAEWDAATTYYIGSWCTDGTGTPYVSITDTNLNNAVSDTTKWRRATLTGPGNALNYGITSSVGASALTINLVNNVAATPSAVSPALFSLRNATAATGSYNVRSVTGALNITVPSGATLGGASGVDAYIYVYLIDNAGSLELAVSGSQYTDASIITTVAISGGATSLQTIYSTTLRASVPIKLIGRLKVNETTAGTWASVPTEQALGDIFPYIANPGDNALATVMGTKVYAHGGSYNGGLAPTITLTGGGGTLGAINFSAFIPYQIQDGNWRLKFNIQVGLSVTTRTSTELTVAGINNGFAQAITGNCGTTTSLGRANANLSNPVTLSMEYSSVTSGGAIFSGDIAIAAKPTWAY